MLNITEIGECVLVGVDELYKDYVKCWVLGVGC